MTGSGPLDGLTVVEIGRYITAPYAAMLLADLGARVIKVEAPDGDPFRVWRKGEQSPRFLAFNRGKESFTLDLAQTDGREALARLLDRADVLVHNFRPAGARRLGLDWSTISGRHPRLVLCSITGGGAEGALATRPMYDQIGQALSGMMSVLSGVDSPSPVGPALSDAVTGLSSAYGILAALHKRQRTGNGEHVEVSLMQATVSFLGEPAADYFASGSAPGPTSRPHLSQSYGFQCADGRPIVIHLSTPTKFWRATLEVVGCEELAQRPEFSDYTSRVANYDAIYGELAPRFAARDSADWLEVLEAADVPCAPINTMEDVFTSDELLALGVMAEMDDHGEVQRGVGRAVSFDGLPGLVRPPRLGEHNDQILAELGYDGNGAEKVLRRS